MNTSDAQKFNTHFAHEMGGGGAGFFDKFLSTISSEVHLYRPNRKPLQRESKPKAQ